ncbi:unnamed protein product [Notodromas monacha]|uniref:Histone acetyltransferase n=1 Tax=Notodromas monacha TaxID=399045 RepID=A0A7R9BT20_9CRUS|nr:unnamed protein product [Notodromas monacha]CAG0919836.1 unnamed protein product [Notodromas monacha]
MSEEMSNGPDNSSLWPVNESPHTVGENYVVSWPDRTLHPAAIIQTRYKDSLGKFEHYVHYTGANRRLDEWVTKERIERVDDSQFSLTNARVGEVSGNGVNHLKNVSKLLKPEDSFENSDRKITRHQKRMHVEMNHLEENNGFDSHGPDSEHDALPQIKLIKCIEFGRYEIDTWYYSPYPEIPGEAREDKLFVCEYCFKYTSTESTFRLHQTQCTRFQPPGQEIYRKGALSLYEVDGKEEKLYCQCLCLLAKLFLDHKTLYFSVEPFRFYILTEVDHEGAHFVGYFSKEKESSENYNVACIMTLPPFQRKGYGKFLIQFSYELSKRECQIGTPEKPLSDLGKVSYKSYWTWILLNIMKGEERLTIKDLSHRTSIQQEDIIQTLMALKMVKYWKGQHVICISPKNVLEYVATCGLSEPRIQVDPAAIRWDPPKKPSKKCA